MTHLFCSNRIISRCAWLLLLLLGCLGGGRQTAGAQVEFGFGLWHGYDFYYPQPALNVPGPAPLTFHWVENGDGSLWRQFGGTNGSSSFNGSNDLSAILNISTNGVWKLYLNKDHPSEEVYYFGISISGVTTQLLGDVAVIFPVDGSSGVTNQPVCEWTGPGNFAQVDAYIFHDTGNQYNVTLPGTATTWAPGVLSPGDNDLLLIYRTNNYPGIVISTPTNSAGVPLAGWTVTRDLQSYRYSFFVVTGNTGGGGHRLEAHYSFENGGIFANDYSGNNNNIGIIASSGGGTRYTTNSPALGSFSAYFFNNGGAGGGWLRAPTNLLSTLADSFTVSAWVRTTQTSGVDTDAGLFGNAGLVTAFSGPGGNWVVPMALTGNKLAFATGGASQDTLHSIGAITNASAFVHVAVTRNRLTGEKRIYLNGALDSTGSGATDLLDSPTELNIGYNNGTGLEGFMDEIQFYSGVLSADKIQFLYNNPGSTVPDDAGSGDLELAEATDASNIVWTTGGDTDWFLQTEETNGGDDAAQSGATGDNGSSWIQATVTGPGYFSFYWNVSSDDQDGYDYLELAINGEYVSEIAGEWGWAYEEVYLSEGVHNLRWTYYKDGEFSAGLDAGFLDEVQFTHEVEVGMTLVIERTNDPENPGYFAYPSIDFFSPVPITSYRITGPNGMAEASVNSSSEGSTGYQTFATLGQLVSAMQSGLWRLSLNPGHPQGREFTFDVSVNSLDLTNLPLANFTSPTEWQTGIAPNHLFTWTGPTNFDSAFLYSYVISNGAASGGFTNPGITATSVVMPNPLLPGTNAVYLNYKRSAFEDVVINQPVDAQFNSPWSWSAQTDLVSSQTRRFVVGGSTPPAMPVQILTPQKVGANFGFGLQTQLGRTHTVQARTNLTTAPWVDVTNFVGDGTLWQLQIPIPSASESYFRVGTQ